MYFMIPKSANIWYVLRWKGTTGYKYGTTLGLVLLAISVDSSALLSYVGFQRYVLLSGSDFIMLRLLWDHVSTYISGNVKTVDVIIKLYEGRDSYEDTTPKLSNTSKDPIPRMLMHDRNVILLVACPWVRGLAETRGWWVCQRHQDCLPCVRPLCTWPAMVCEWHRSSGWRWERKSLENRAGWLTQPRLLISFWVTAWELLEVQEEELWLLLHLPLIHRCSERCDAMAETKNSNITIANNA